MIGGIYYEAQIDLSHNFQNMEGSCLAYDQTRFIFETNTIGFEKKAVHVDDVIEAANYFHCINMVITLAQP